MAYDMPERAKAFIQKRQRGMDRCRQYISDVDATWVIPSAGPPCFLDDELRFLNDDCVCPDNIFPDQMVFLEQMRLHGHTGGLLMIPGSVADFQGSQLISLTHPMPDAEVESIFTTGRLTYIGRLRRADGSGARRREGELGPGHRGSAAEPLRARFEPIMVQSDQICDGIEVPGRAEAR